MVAMQGLSAEDRLVLGALTSRLRPARRERRGRLVPGPAGALVTVAAPRELADSALRQPAATPKRSRLQVQGRPPRPRPRLSPVRQVRTLWRGVPVLVAGTVAGLIAGMVVLPSLLPSQSTYRAAVVVEIERFTADRVVPGMDQGGWTRDELVSSTLDLDLSGQVVRRLGNRAARLRVARDSSRAAWPARLLAHLEARAVPSSDRQVEISYVDVSPELASAVVDSYARRFAVARGRVDRARTATAVRLLRRQAEDLRTGLAEWAQRVDQERAASPSGTASTITQTEFELFARRYDNKLAEVQRLRDQAALRIPVTRIQLPAAVRTATRPPDPRLVDAAAALLGLLVAAALILLAEAAAPRVATATDAEAATGADLAITVPRLSGRRSGLTPAAEGDAFGAQAEAYRRLAGTLERRGVGSDAFVLAVMSADPGEGRSTIAVEPGHSLARGGRAVLLVSGDLGRPSIERVYGLKQDVRGMGEHLAGLADELALLLIVVRENLMLLPAGMPVRNPAELLTGARLERLMEQLRDLGTLVVLDTPPARWAADALSLADAADATLIVTRANRSRWRATVELATALRRDRVHGRGARRAPPAPAGPSRPPGRVALGGSRAGRGGGPAQPIRRRARSGAIGTVSRPAGGQTETGRTPGHRSPVTVFAVAPSLGGAATMASPPSLQTTMVVPPAPPSAPRWRRPTHRSDRAGLTGGHGDTAHRVTRRPRRAVGVEQAVARLVAVPPAGSKASGSQMTGRTPPASRELTVLVTSSARASGWASPPTQNMPTSQACIGNRAVALRWSSSAGTSARARRNGAGRTSTTCLARAGRELEVARLCRRPPCRADLQLAHVATAAAADPDWERRA